MSLLLQQFLVGVLVIACALFSAWRLSSVRLRLRALDALGAWRPLGSAAWLVRLRERTLAQQLRACGGCAAPPAHPSKSRAP
jgi:hypothetical protein